MLSTLRNGPFGHRQFRFLFASRTVSLIGSSFSYVALAFAVLQVSSSKADVGYVLASRSVSQIIFLLIGGILADRLPRPTVMVVSNLTSGMSQAAVALLLLTGQAQVWHLMLLAGINGISSAFFFPAAAGMVPQTVPKPLLQRANATLRLGMNATQITGAAIGGLVVAATSPGVAVAVDAGSFFVAAVLTMMIRLPTSLRMPAKSLFEDLAVGWREFSSRTWLWAIVLQCGFTNAISLGTEGVLGPVISIEHFGGAAGWGLIVTSQSLGLAAGGLLLLRFHPRHILRTGILALLLTLPLLIGLAVPLPLFGLFLLGLMAGIGIEISGVLWDTALQQRVPEDKLSRVASYDAVGSFALMPLGLAIAGPISELVGTRATLIGGACINLAAILAVLAIRDVRTFVTTADRT
jgi:MFS family permease